MQRRRFLQTAAAASCAATGAAALPPAAASPAVRSIRLAHLTDVHVQPELAAEKGFAACLRHVQDRSDPPEMILFGGDCVMDVFAQGAERCRTVAGSWRRVLAAECSLPSVSAIGNHDVWGWNKPRSGTSGDEAGWGKRWAEELLGLDRRYHSRDLGGWHLVVLDSTFPRGDEYVARLDDEQFDWLAAELATTPITTPVVVLSHIPIFSAASFLDGQNERSGDWQVPGAWMHIDLRRIKDLFLRHPQVKLCLSGHLHLVDEVRYNGVTYVCNGAVSGAWWKGDHQECRPGYGLVDLHADGSFSCGYEVFGWSAETER